ncbi:zincin-like metallopeptidase toxin domain-containing protein [uncultured Dokdonia sp.]|uniref:zincin-like metallopeptidase toxin domain-containing protein n=1 Tax=uncultured Dokdonia sp. TaxID=575653 RepID=UPI002638AA90|nr:zincin-like metallopeptidase toxin domain-containing protein [uncultured Dokdonia sp.]
MANTIDGFSKNQFFGQYQSPFGEESLFHSYLDIEEGLTQSIDANDGYTYKLIPLVSGVAVFEKYNSQAPEDLPSSKQLFIYYEKGDDTSLDFFGTACRVKFGTERKVLMEKISARKTVIRLGDREVRTLSEWSSVVANRLRIETDVLLTAINLELSGLLNDKTMFKYLLGLNNDLANWIYAGSNKMEEWKFTAKNYEYGKWRASTQKEYEPIIPVFFETRTKDFLTTNNKNTNSVKDKGFDHLVNFVNNFDSILFNPQAITQVIPGVADDAVVLFARAIYQDKLPDQVRQLLTKIKAIVNQAKVFINTIKEKINTNTALFNALLCGIINGLISLLQLVVLIIGYIIDNFAILELEKPFSREEFDKSGQSLEFVEDLIETLSERSEKIFNGLLLNFITASTQFVALVDSIYKKLKNVSRYFIAFILGAIIFEVVFDAIIAFFTGGASLAVSLANKISRASTKATQAGIKLAKQAGKKVVASTTDILRFLRAEFDELIQAIINGKFLDYVRKRLESILGIKVKPSQSDLLESWDNVLSVSGRGRRGGQRLTRSNLKLLKSWLARMGVKLELHALEGSQIIDGFFIRKGVPAKMPEGAAALFITDGKKMTIVLRKGSTVYEFFHEFMHFRHAKSLGLKKYLALGGRNTPGELIKERSVFDKISQYRKYFTKEELKHALRYLNEKVYKKNSIEPIDFNFDIEKIPEIRREIKMSEIINKK